jgi:hypothetical protein
MNTGSMLLDEMIKMNAKLDEVKEKLDKIDNNTGVKP